MYTTPIFYASLVFIKPRMHAWMVIDLRDFLPWPGPLVANEWMNEVFTGMQCKLSTFFSKTWSIFRAWRWRNQNITRISHIHMPRQLCSVWSPFTVFDIQKKQSWRCFKFKTRKIHIMYFGINRINTLHSRLVHVQPKCGLSYEMKRTYGQKSGRIHNTFVGRFNEKLILVRPT